MKINLISSGNNLKFLFYKLTLITLAVLVSAIDSHSQWKKVNIPSNLESSEPFLEVMFLKSNPKLGWICGFESRVLRTVDGGNTWTGTRIPGFLQLESIHFLDSLNGYTSGGGRILKSTDGGVTWRDITDPRTNVILWGNYFVTPNIGMVIGGGCSPDKQQFFRTTNGGSSWSLYERNVYDSGLTDLFLTSANGPGYAVSSGKLLRTLDGGMTWNDVATTGANDWQEELAINGNSFLLPYSEGCSGGGIGGNGGVRISKDGGVNWREYSTGSPMFGTFLQDEKRGWVVGWNRKIYYTSDAGNTWVLRNCGIEPGDNLDDIWFINDTTGWVVGINIYKSFNYDTLNPVITTTGTNICEGDSVILTVNNNFPHYIWSTGERTKSIVVKKSGTYYVTVSNTECDSTKSNIINITFNPLPQPQIIVSDSIICEDDSARLTLTKSYYSMNWSTGEITQSIIIKKEGKYSVTVTDSNGCSSTASQYVTVIANPKPEIKKSSRLVSCVGDSIILETSPAFAEYSWFNADKNQLVGTGKNKIVVTEDGNFYVIVKNSYGCIGVSDTVPANFIIDSNRIRVDILSSSMQYLQFDSTNLLGIICKKLRIRNVGIETEIINDISIMRNIEFSIPQAQFPITLFPNDSFDVEVCYAPTALGEQNDTLILNDHCYPHLVPLLGIGEPNIMGGKSNCDIPVELISTGLYGYLLKVSPPSPNPSGNTVTLAFSRFLPVNESIFESCKLYNSFGSVKATGNLIIREQKQNSNGTISNGNIIFDVSGLSDGIYYAIIKAKAFNYIYTVAIVK